MEEQNDETVPADAAVTDHEVAPPAPGQEVYDETVNDEVVREEEASQIEETDNSVREEDGPQPEQTDAPAEGLQAEE